MKVKLMKTMQEFFNYGIKNLILVEDMIKEVDVDGDGRIDFDEFVYALGEPEDSQEDDPSTEDSCTSPTSPEPLPL